MFSRVMQIDLIQRLLSKPLRSFNWAPVRQMLGCKCFTWTRVPDLIQPGPDRFSLPGPIPQWPEGTGFSTGIIDIGELEVFQITKFEFIWGEQGVSFYKPVSIPEGFSCLGHYCQSNNKPLQGFVLVARGVDSRSSNYSPPLRSPVDYSLIWISDDDGYDNCGFFWLPQPPEGYKALGFVVTSKSEKPDLEEVKCVRADLTDACETHRTILETHSKLSNVPLRVFNTRPVHRGIHGRGVSVGAFHCSSGGETRSITCLKNLDTDLRSMPSLDQVHALIAHYGPTLFFHPDEVYLPSSVSWFFRNGALLYSKRDPIGHAIDPEGSNLPSGGTNDGTYWIDLPLETERASFVKHGNLESAKLYAHVKPALGGTFTDIAMWVFCPFNGPGILKIGPMDIALSKVGRHVGDWEHFTLRISNFSGELYSVYFSQHSGGEWVESCDLEFVEGNKAAVYSSRNGHASFPRPGAHIQGSERIGVGVRNDAVRSDDKFVESSRRYEIVAAEYLGAAVVVEPRWLGYMGAWGPKVVYELDRVVKILPLAVENILGRLPVELYGEEGPTGPKAKNNWVGDDKW